jgi:hypothetical protein
MKRKPELIKILEHFPLENWSVVDLAYNPNLTWKFVKNNLHFNWPYDILSKNPIITINIIENNSNIEWSFYNFSENPNINIKYVKANINKKWNWSALSKNIDFGDILSNMSLPWDWFCISQNETVTEDVFFKYITLPWDVEGICSNPNMTIKIFKYINNINKLTLRQLDEIYKNIMLDDTILNELLVLNAHQNFDSLSYNRWLRCDMIEKYHESPWNWKLLSMHPNIDLNFIYNHLDYPWMVSYVARNPNTPIYSRPHKQLTSQWNSDGLSANPNLTCDYMIKHIDINWNFHLISENLFTPIQRVFYYANLTG